MKNKILFAVILGAFCFEGAQGQMDLNSANYFINPFVLNPAYAGKFKQQSILIDVRKDATGIDGSPTSQYLSYDWGVVPNKIGIGFLFKNDVEGLMRHHLGYASFSYRAQIADDHFFDLGVNAGLVYRGINFDNVRAKDAQESVLLSENSYSSAFDGGAGFRYVFKDFEAGLAINHITEPSFSYTNTIDQTNLQSILLRQYIATIGYNYEINQDFDLKPLVVLRSAHGAPIKFEGGAAGWWKDQIWLGILYKQDLGINATVGLELSEKLSFAYSYHYYTSSLSNVSTGAHEVILGIRLGKKNDPENDERFEELSRQNSELFEQLEVLKQKGEARRKQINDLEQGYSEAEKDSMKALIDGLQELHDHYYNNEEEIEKEKEIHGVSMEQLETASDIEDLKEKKADNYMVIVGACPNSEQAIKMMKILKRTYQLETNIVRNPKSVNFGYLLYSKDCENQEDCKDELQRMRKIDTQGVIKGEPWMFRSEQ